MRAVQQSGTAMPTEAVVLVEQATAAVCHAGRHGRRWRSCPDSINPDRLGLRCGRDATGLKPTEETIPGSRLRITKDSRHTASAGPSLVEIPCARAAIRVCMTETSREAPSSASARPRTGGRSTGSGGRSRAAQGQTRSAVLVALSSGEAMTAGEVAAATGLGRASVSTTLSKLVKTGEVAKADRGYRRSNSAAATRCWSVRRTTPKGSCARSTPMKRRRYATRSPPCTHDARTTASGPGSSW